MEDPDASQLLSHGLFPCTYCAYRYRGWEVSAARASKLNTVIRLITMREMALLILLWGQQPGVWRKGKIRIRPVSSNGCQLRRGYGETSERCFGGEPSMELLHGKVRGYGLNAWRNVSSSRPSSSLHLSVPPVWLGCTKGGGSRRRGGLRSGR